ncbi:MAG: Tex family protein [Pseudomonadota bacterium]
MIDNTEHRISRQIAAEIACRVDQVNATRALLDEGATIPFIARYRKEATGGLDDIQLRTLAERLDYLQALEQRRQSILSSIDEQGKLSASLRAEIDSAETKQALEDLYLPYKAKRRTKAQIAREAGLAALAESLLNDPMCAPEHAAEAYLNVEAGFADSKSVLDGARQILMEQFAESASLLGTLRRYLHSHGVVQASLIEGKAQEGAKFRDYFDYQEALKDIPSHRALALFRARNEGILQLALKLDSELASEQSAADAQTTRASKTGAKALNPCEQIIATHFGVAQQNRPADAWLNDTVRWAWRIKIFLHLELELMGELRERAETEAIRVFGTNLKDLLLAAPAGAQTTMGLDPGLRTGVKVAVVDATGKLLETATIYPHEPRRDWSGALHTLKKLVLRHQVRLISIGNGTASRETDRLATELIEASESINTISPDETSATSPQLANPGQQTQAKLRKIVVSEAGASVYSASEYASREFPELDVSLRGAVSIARRLQDPLAELVKIEPKAIGVGQYQHDVSQSRLANALDAVVEDCVNAVGVDLNTASIPLLTRVSGLNASLASNIVAHRDTHGSFRHRQALKAVPRLGEKTFEQAAGFLRIRASEQPLDASSVHPEAYPLVQRILDKLGKSIEQVIGNSQLINSLSAAEYADEQFGLPTVQDILKELEKPGRDPRPEFKTASFKDGIETLKDLQTGMILEGVVTNVANFGAFVDIGVHQDGLVHVSALADKFVKDPHECVKAGDIVKVRVIEIDLARQRIALSMRLNDTSKTGTPAPSKQQAAPRKPPAKPESSPAPSQFNAMANAFAKLKR